MSEDRKYSRSKYHHRHSRIENSYDTKYRKHKSTSTRDNIDSGTPPLPVKLTGTMHDLLKQRETIKEELKRMQDPPRRNTNTHLSNDLEKKRENRHIKSNPLKESRSKRKVKHEAENINLGVKKKIRQEDNIININSPESSDNNISLHSDEDEESLIEQRRNKRKQLIEKLINAKESKTELGEPVVSSSSINSTTDNNNVQIAAKNNLNSKQEVADMFAESDDFKVENIGNTKKSFNDNKECNENLTDNWDDAEGYYKIKIGETLNNKRYVVKKILGQGVFANVIQAQDKSQGDSEVAIKLLRNNDLMYKTGLKEMSFLKKINYADPENKYHCIKFLTNFMHRGHLCIVIESMSIDLRCVLKKYGKRHGINMKALLSYSRQLLLALKLLKKIGIIHADIKPDNILVNEKKNILKLCDFGSASRAEDNEPTPYLVSRFYRAPEVILGLPYDHGVDMWSTACTIYELGTGKIMFTGNSNNKMLKCFMDLKGKIPNKLIRKSKFKDKHFNYKYNFLLSKQDEVTGREKVVEMCNINAVRNLQLELKHAFKELPSSEERKITQLKDLLDKMLMLDPNQRPPITDCLKHAFVRDEIQNY